MSNHSQFPLKSSTLSSVIWWSWVLVWLGLVSLTTFIVVWRSTNWFNEAEINSKTQLQRIQGNRIYVPFLGKELTPVPHVKDLSVILDSNMSFNDHVSTFSFSLLSVLGQIDKVRHLFSREVLYSVLNSVVFSKPFYCSTVWAGTSKINLHKLQLMQNFAARILTYTRKFDHKTPVFKKLGWLTIKKLINLRDVTINGI